MTNVVLAGGGTAGHTSPLIATAHRLLARDPQTRIVAVGTPKGLETRVVPAAGLELQLIDPVPLPRTLNLDLLKVPLRLRRSINQARRILRSSGADVLVGFGGYVAMPTYVAARELRIPIVVHEQNAVPGLANKVATRFTDRIAVTFPGTPLRHARVVGMPLRPEVTGLDRDAVAPGARAGFGLEEGLPTLLVSGGSQGARSINNAIADAYPELIARGIQVLHVLGPRNFRDDMVPVVDEATGASYRPIAYVDAMEKAYAVADLMVGRSGAGTVMETIAVGLPTVLVPLPHGNGEQARNADALVAAGGALRLADAECTGDRLVDLVAPLVTDPARLARMREAGRGMVPGNAADLLCDMILEAARR
ncbi:UDP-N-acetylglucosamine-N-acetylmuramylpentapeptide N-acetylglucosamine transferase [Raineyella antarctica]|uniref:UDP-N-acetylglucosamine--N-acetylmuramyl-(pentapeptide) pyrophosphoryl-undecaprenol N-acetylglucosamine transferase n=1 Tax=Raineyella antarctica TaxID=1577474 RepID=A0A1G6GDS7_9ACTN|nr:undecaprenyldiphospho-muramoylpentapeptide beta-N-acetylglucosaminyltransferase [Raineyella antarctica]SDB80162.1 UDP-N-acetylglucosamine-N-acetylmuramylpentapeptide N-acetylglucosamine transferase [Raineyella antarctica]